VSIYIGVDAGGTKTSVIVADGDRVIARATGGPGAVRAGRALPAASRIAVAVREALTSARLLQGDTMVVGAAGVGRDPERGELRDALRIERVASRTIVTGDLDIALEAAHGQGPGIVLVSGTGSVALARDKAGGLHRAGGYGWQMGDEGSGYSIARAALLAVGRAQDGRGPTTALLAAILAAGLVKSFDELVRWTNAAEPREIAALAPAVFGAASRGDAVARGLVDAAADELAALVAPLIAAFGGKGTIPVALSGGHLAPGRPLRAPVETRLKRERRLEILEAPLDPAEGALAMARRII
jgi:N-acetylglucosamine kinase-like BadF-type ATPase